MEAVPVVEREHVASIDVVVARARAADEIVDENLHARARAVVAAAIRRPLADPERVVAVAALVHPGVVLPGRGGDVALVVVDVHRVEGVADLVQRRLDPVPACDRGVDVVVASGEVGPVDEVDRILRVAHELEVGGLGAVQPWPRLFGSLCTSKSSTR
jgi:hypothetical protein